jgi:hypothetical protein
MRSHVAAYEPAFVGEVEPGCNHGRGATYGSMGGRLVGGGRTGVHMWAWSHLTAQKPTSCTTRNIVIGCALSEAVHLEPLPDRISTAVQDLNRC